MRNKSGVYQIRNSLNGHIYVGSSVDIRVRWNVHRGTLRKGKHHCQHLQRAWDKYGEASFEFHVLFHCSREDARFYEQRSLDVLNPEYNSSRRAEDHFRGIPHTPEHNLAIGQALKGRVTSESMRMAVAEANRKRVLSPETREKLRNRKQNKNRDASGKFRKD